MQNTMNEVLTHYNGENYIQDFSVITAVELKP